MDGQARPGWRDDDGYRALASGQPQSLNVIRTVLCQAPYRRLGAFLTTSRPWPERPIEQFCFLPPVTARSVPQEDRSAYGPVVVRRSPGSVGSVRCVREYLARDDWDGAGREPVPDAIEPDEASVWDLGGERLRGRAVLRGPYPPDIPESPEN
jgi:hypothetical protein